MRLSGISGRELRSVILLALTSRYLTRENAGPSHFSIGEKKQPLALVLLFDLWHNGAGRFFLQVDIPKSLDTALSKLSPKDEVAVIGVTGKFFKTRQQELTGFTNDRKKILDALFKLPELVDPDSSGVFFVADLLSDVASMARRQRPDSQIVVVYVSDSLNSATPRDRQLGTQNLLRQNVTFGALLTKTKKSVTARSAPFMPLIMAFGISSNVADYFAKQTGGEAVKVYKPEEYRAGLEKIMDDLSSRYTLGFELDANEPDDGKLHRLEVKVKANDKSGKPRTLEVVARRGYFLPKPQQAVVQQPQQPVVQQPQQPIVQKTVETEANRFTTDPAKRQTDEQAIKKSVYELHYSVMTGDIEGVKRLTTKRTLDLTRFLFDLLFKRLSDRDGGQDIPASSGDELFKLILGMVAEGAKDALNAEQIRAKAQAKAECRITFTAHRSATIEYSDGVFAKAIFEDGLWKIDDTERLKEGMLKMNELTPEEKERIRKH